MEAGGENPLLDSRFPDVSAKGRGYQLQSYPEGIEGWPSLRRVTIWQTVAALELEFRERAAKFAEAKRNAENNQSQSNDLKLESQDVAETPSVETMAVGKSFAEETAEKAEKMTKKSEKSENAEEAVETVSEVAERKEEQVLQKRASKSSMKALALSEVKENSKLSSDEPSGSPSVSRYSVARPHHIPKVESLSKKLDQIRSEMGEEVCVFCLSLLTLRRDRYQTGMLLGNL
jgi:hypothetical protein